MRRIAHLCIMVLCGLVPLLFAGCGSTRREVVADKAPVSIPAAKFKVMDVSNNTGEIFDVDVIGMMWNGMEDALKKEGMLWTEKSSTAPIELNIHIVAYEKGNLIARYLSPVGGSTRLAVKCDVNRGGRLITTIETREAYTFGNGLTFGAWRKIFNRAAEELTRELRLRMTG